MDSSNLKSAIKSRALKCISLSNGILERGEYYLAGSSIATLCVRDIDIYPVEGREFTIPADNRVSETRNAVTIKNDPPLQFCRYKKPSLSALISSFDFAHIQAGAHISDGVVLSVEWTESFLFAKATGTSSFTGSEYPLSSAIRLMKYHSRGEITSRYAMCSMINIIAAVVARGFDGYEDFKDQLDAVDLGLIPDEVMGIAESNLKELFELLDRKGRKELG